MIDQSMQSKEMEFDTSKKDQMDPMFVPNLKERAVVMGSIRVEDSVNAPPCDCTACGSCRCTPCK